MPGVRVAVSQGHAWDVLLDRGQQLVVLPDHLHPRARRLGDERPHERRDLRQHVTLLGTGSGRVGLGVGVG